MEFFPPLISKKQGKTKLHLKQNSSSTVRISALKPLRKLRLLEKLFVCCQTAPESVDTPWIPKWFGKHTVSKMVDFNIKKSQKSNTKKKVDVSKNRGEKNPKWMVKIIENPIKMDDLGGFSHIFGGPPMFKIQ